MVAKGQTYKSVANLLKNKSFGLQNKMGINSDKLNFHETLIFQRL